MPQWFDRILHPGGESRRRRDPKFSQTREELCETSCFDSEIMRYLGTARTLMQLESEGFQFPIVPWLFFHVAAGVRPTSRF